MTPLPCVARWRFGQIKNLAEVTLGKMLQSNKSGDDTFANYMRAANVQPDGVLMLEPKQMWFSGKELDVLTLRRGDVVVVEGGVGGYGRAAYLSEDLEGWGFQNSINRLRPAADTDGRFLAYYLIALRAAGFIERYCNVVSMPHLTAEKLAAIPAPIPPRTNSAPSQISSTARRPASTRSSRSSSSLSSCYGNGAKRRSTLCSLMVVPRRRGSDTRSISLKQGRLGRSYLRRST